MKSALQICAVLLMLGGSVVPLPAGAADGCPSDCSGDRRVSIDELVRCVGIVLGTGTLEQCPRCDGDSNGTVAINDLVTGVNASLGALRLVANGICWQPGPEGLISCAPGTTVRMLRCDDVETCLDESGTGTTPMTEVDIGEDGTFSTDVDGCAVASAAIIIVADVSAETDFRVIDLGSAAARSGRLGIAGGQNPPLTDLRIGPESEAATRLLADTGLASFDDAQLDALFAAADAAVDDSSFAGLDPEAAAELALDVASDDPAVQAILAGSSATPTPTPTPPGVVEWVGGDGRWGDPTNWSTGATPGPGDDVRIAGNGAPAITHDGGDTQIGSLVVEDNLVISGGTITVHDDSTVSGSLTCSSGLAAEGAGVVFEATGAATIDGCNLEARAGARIRIPSATSYDSHPTAALAQRIWRATGAGSGIELPNLATVEAAAGPPARFTIEALAGGSIAIADASLEAGAFAIVADGTGSLVDLTSATSIPSGSSLPKYVHCPPNCVERRSVRTT